MDFDQLDPRAYILVKGARMHNLKNVNIALPRNKFIVITGVSGSGKSSLAFDTLYAEGQRRYVESLSSYARQFMGRMSKPDVDYIKGVSPAIAIEQRVNSRNPRSTVGTSTEVYDYIKLLFARIGKTYSPVSGDMVKRHTVSDVVDNILRLPKQAKVLITSSIKHHKDRSIADQLNIILQQGFTRIYDGKNIIKIEKLPEDQSIQKKSIELLIDRLIVTDSLHEEKGRIADSVQTAFFEGSGKCNITIIQSNGSKVKSFSNRFELDGITFEEPSINLFSFNNPYGACKKCEGFGNVIGIDEDLVIPDKSLSLYEDAVACWKGEKMKEWKEQLILNAYKEDFPVHKAICNLSANEYALLWKGCDSFAGINDFFKYVEEQTYKIQYRVMLSRYRGKTKCPECQGTRLRKDASYVKINSKSISDLVLLSLEDLQAFFQHIKLNKTESKIAKNILTEIINRLEYLNDVGLGYLSLNRLSNTLSGGESQRINLATSLGSSLVGSTYILDEPSIGLHPRDTRKLIGILKKLRDIGNTVIVVEHDEEIILEADEIIDMGPEAGRLGGDIVYQGSKHDLIKNAETYTGKYISKRMVIPLPSKRRKWKNFIQITGARENNLKGIHVKFPLNTLTVVCGVSGSGKSSLVNNILYRGLKKLYGGMGDKTGLHDKMEGDYDLISHVELVDQNPIGRSSRSNPATYVKAYDDIRALFAEQSLSKMRAYKPGYFSFNIPGGRCEECEGDGFVKIEMQFMADLKLICESCKGKRFKDEVLDVKFKDKNITEILDMTVNESIDFFSKHDELSASVKRIINKLQPLKDVGLGYLKIGQASSTLSGGEAQRIKLAHFLSKGLSENPTFFIFDEPTTGLHFHDINKLLVSFNALIEKGHTVVVIEHNTEVIKSADYIIELGPEGGQKGGELIYTGIPEDLLSIEKSYTSSFLSKKL